MLKTIPIVDLKNQYRAIKAMIDERVLSVLSSGNYILGPEVKAFENEFARFLKCKFSAGVNSGTDALYLALLACGVGKDDEVITTPSTFIATAEAIVRCGAKPVFVDVKENDSNIDPDKLEKKITKKTKAILPVHLYGFLCDMDEINTIAKVHKLKVIEDCAQVIGGLYKGQAAGTLSDAGCFSFYPTKNLGAFGDGGAVTSNNESLIEKISVLRTHGSNLRGYYDQLGINSRLDEIQATILRVKLLYMERWNRMRISLGENYDNLFEGKNKIQTFRADPNTHPVYYLYCIMVERRDFLQERLAEMGVTSMVHYPIPLHLVEVFKDLGYKEGDFPIAEKISKQILALPLYPELSYQDQEIVAQEIFTVLGIF